MPATARFRRFATPVVVATALAVSACGGGEVRAGSHGSGAAVAAEAAAAGSGTQDMRDLYALKRDVAAFRRAQSPVAGGGCGVRGQ